MKISEHFTLRELTRSDTAARLGIDNTPDAAAIAALRALCENVLEPLRGSIGRPIAITSGYRSPALNKVIGGSPRSQHCNGEAVDLEVPGEDNLTIAHWLAEWALPFDQLILEMYTLGDPASGWVHVSHRAGENRGQVLTATKDGGRVVYMPGLPPLVTP
jgi:zinc D-Ala-D-Ala carboxypeptidase